MKRILVVAGITVCIALLAVGYLSVVGMKDRIEAASTGNIVEFSNPETAVRANQLSSRFNPVENVTVRLQGLFSGKGGLRPEELNLKVEMTGHHHRRLLDTSDYFVCTEPEMRNHIRRQLVKLTGDQDLVVRRLTLGYLSTN